MIIFLYVDDCGIVSPDMSKIDAFIDRLKAKGFEVTKECDFSAYLEIKFQRNRKNITITMTQPGLIKKVIEATGIELCSANKTPSSQTALGSDPEGFPIKETWKYSSVVGMLLNVSTKPSPDIAFAVSQVAWFNSNPKQSIASAVRMNIRYLSATSDKGIIFTPTTDFKVDCYVEQTLLDCMPENLRTYLQVPTLEHNTSCSSASDLSFGKPTSNRDCT